MLDNIKIRYDRKLNNGILKTRKLHKCSYAVFEK